MKTFLFKKNIQHFNHSIYSGAFIALAYPIPSGGKQGHIKSLICTSESSKNVLYEHFLEVFRVHHSTVVIESKAKSWSTMTNLMLTLFTTTLQTSTRLITLSGSYMNSHAPFAIVIIGSNTILEVI